MTKIYQVYYTSFDGSDDNLYNEVQITTTDKDKAEETYHKEVENCCNDLDEDENVEFYDCSDDETLADIVVERNGYREYIRIELKEFEV
ncbi:MAG: hypothetical protein VZR36_15695 [Prevotella sp.]|nr:hypothetical protein [Prevotella sp.]